MAQQFTAKEMALLCGTDAKTFRRFVRSQAASDQPIINACGQGNRYTFDAETARRLRDAFGSWAERKRSNAPERSIADLESLISDDESDESDENAS
jgi:hypothetical protein